MNNKKSNAEKWDNGSKTDPVRNDFLIPKIRDLVEILRPIQILDIGTGTGYLARTVDVNCSFRPLWTLIDIDSNRIQYAQKKAPESMQLNTFTGNFLKIKNSIGQHNLVLLIFTLLELDLNLELFASINKVTAIGGSVVIAIPDSLEDVHKAALHKPNLINDFIDGKCVLEKTDKFTGEKYPFKAHRFEYIVQLMLYSNFNMTGMYSHKPAGKVTHMLVFKKTEDLN